MALADAQMQPDDLRYMEASGLGEPYGDAVEVGAYQALFQPGRRRDNPLIFGSVHTNIGHLDGASGIIAFAKAVLLTQQQTVPPIVHFKTLHPLVTGLKAGADEATRMGHTYNEEVNVRGFPALFPMAASPLAAASRTRSCPAGVSAFGFGGTMAHMIVDGQPAATVDRVRAPLRYKHAVSFPWQALPGDNPAEKFQEYGELALGYLEGMVRACVEPHVHVETDVPRGGDIFAAGLSRDAARTVSLPRALRLAQRIANGCCASCAGVR
jgi:acyl transferase domain-containing protein